MKILLQQIITGISIGSIYALIASGYALVYSLLDFSNWAHGEVCMLGAYVCFMATQVDAHPVLACLCDWYWRRGGHQLFERACGIPQDPQQRFPEYVSDDRSHGTFHDLPEPGKCDMEIQIQAAPKAVQGRYDQYQRYFYRKDGYALSGALGDRTGHFAVPDQ